MDQIGTIFSMLLQTLLELLRLFLGFIIQVLQLILGFAQSVFGMIGH